MRLTDLSPRWLLNPSGEKIGFAFRCPTRLKSDTTVENWQTCFFVASTHKQQEAAVEVALLADGEPPRIVQYCNPAVVWSASPLDFEKISVNPSIDGSAGGNWHGNITNGEIVGGL